MCGICGIFKYNSFLDGYSTCQNILKHQHFRGPDDSNIWHDHSTIFGQRRLIIRDADGGKQPMVSSDSNVILNFNGEIYNSDALRKELSKNYFFNSTHSDTEVVLHAYREYGENFVDKLRGMFAIAILDKTKDQLLLFRDRLGIKPLFYFEDEGSLYFSSDYISLLHAFIKKKSINKNILNSILSMRHCIGNETIIEGIFEIEPGHFLIKNEKNTIYKRYWSLNYHVDYSISEFEATEEVNKLLNYSAKIHNISDVKIGVFLSGGIDSSLIAALANSHNPSSTLNSYSVGFYESTENEFHYAQLVADSLKLKHSNISHSIYDLKSDFDSVLRHLGQPIAARDSYPLYLVSRGVQRGTPVVLTGTGSDEIMNGYGNVFFNEDKIAYKDTISDKALRYLMSYGIGDTYGIPGFDNKDLLLQFISPKWFDLTYPIEQIKRILQNFRNNTNDVDATQNEIDYFHIHNHLPYWELTLADTMTMASSIEGRVPFLDHVFVEYIAKLPPQYKKNKKIIRTIAEKYIPMEIIKRKKVGFSRTFVSAFSNTFSDLLENIQFEDRGIFNLNGINKAKEEKNFEILWRCLVVERWLQLFID